MFFQKVKFLLAKVYLHMQACFRRFSILAWFATGNLGKINMSNCTFFESLWRDELVDNDTNIHRLLNQTVWLNNASKRTPNLANFRYTTTYTLSSIRNGSLILISLKTTHVNARNYLLRSKFFSLNPIQNTTVLLYHVQLNLLQHSSPMQTSWIQNISPMLLQAPLW